MKYTLKFLLLLTMTSELRVLLLGEGNFSFSLALAKHPHHYIRFIKSQNSHSIKITATSFDPLNILLEKYHDFKDIQFQLLSYRNVTLIHEVNAWELKKHFSSEFDLLVWNHPHLGIEDFRLHRYVIIDLSSLFIVLNVTISYSSFILIFLFIQNVKKIPKRQTDI
jgi:hypothetical protein